MFEYTTIRFKSVVTVFRKGYRFRIIYKNHEIWPLNPPPPPHTTHTNAHNPPVGTFNMLFKKVSLLMYQYTHIWDYTTFSSLYAWFTEQVFFYFSRLNGNTGNFSIVTLLRTVHA